MTIAEQRYQLECRLTAGMPFTDIEEWIDRLAGTEDVKAALWLLAWAEQDQPVQRRVACEALALVAS